MSYKITTTNQLREILNEGVYRFNFKKKDGSIRNALGTRNLDLIPRDQDVKHLEDISRKAVVFWDLEEGEYRSFSNSSEVAVSGNLI